MTKLLWTGYNYTESEVFVGEALGQGEYIPATPGNGWPGVYGNAAKVVRTAQKTRVYQPGEWIDEIA